MFCSCLSEKHVYRGCQSTNEPEASEGESSRTGNSRLNQAAKCKWRALRHICLLLLSVLGGMPASHQGMQARLFFVVDI